MNQPAARSLGTAALTPLELGLKSGLLAQSLSNPLNGTAGCCMAGGTCCCVTTGCTTSGISTKKRDPGANPAGTCASTCLPSGAATVIWPLCGMITSITDPGSVPGVIGISICIPTGCPACWHRCGGTVTRTMVPTSGAATWNVICAGTATCNCIGALEDVSGTEVLWTAGGVTVITGRVHPVFFCGGY
jgi:hypothetical protein